MAHDVLAEKFVPDPDEISLALSSVGFGAEIHGVSTICGGLLNSNISVLTDEGRILLRVYPLSRERSEIVFEVEVLKTLAVQRFPAPTVLAEGAIGTIRDRPFIIMEFLDGRTLGEDDQSVSLSATAGALLGAFHRALDGFVSTSSKARCDVEYIHALLAESASALLPADAYLLSECADFVWLRAGSGEWGSPDGVVHADFYVENLIQTDSGEIALIDFDDSYYGTQLFDVAIGAMEFACRDDQSLDEERLGAFLSEYKKQRPEFEPSEGALLNAMLVNCLRFLCYTLPISMELGEGVQGNAYYRRVNSLAEFRPKADE